MAQFVAIITRLDVCRRYATSQIRGWLMMSPAVFETRLVQVKNRSLRLACAAAAIGAAFAVPAVGQRPALGMLDQLDPGRWELRLREAGSAPERICINNGRRLIQLRHPDSNCERFTVSDTPAEVTVQYTCRGNGYGRTQIRRETDQLVQIQTQGIVGGLPFDFSAEARRIGDCA